MSLRSLHTAALLALSLASGAAPGASFMISPVRVTLTAGEPTAAITISNGGEAPAVVQLEVTRWTQQEGADGYQATRDLIATPPIFTIAPKEAQIVRLRLRHPPDSRRELTYRVYVTEVPPAPGADFAGARVSLRLGVPVFVTPIVASAQSLQWQLLRGAQGELSIAARNDGTVHARITDISLSRVDGPPVFQQAIGEDVHGGQLKEWPLRNLKLPEAAGTLLRLVAKTERGGVQADVVVP